MMTDPIADMLSTIRNGQQAKLAKVSVPASTLRANILDVLKREGYIRDHAVKDVRKGVSRIEIELKYYEGEPVIKEVWRESKPGRRVYTQLRNLPKVNNGLGIYIISTSKGLKSDNEARAAKLGGEVICGVF